MTARCRSSPPCTASAWAAASGWPGNADIVVAADDATFGLPEVDRGALGAATHLSRLVPQPLMRAMVYTCRTGHAPSSCTASAPCSTSCRPPSCGPPRGPWPARSPAKDPAVIRLAKQSLNGIDPVDVKRSYRYEQGFTFELNLTGAADAGAPAVRGRLDVAG